MGLRLQTLRERTTRRERTGGAAQQRLRDRFELLLPLGSGGFGTVWEGFDMLLERPVAIKELRLSGDADDLADALREARATARLNHPAIVSLYEVISEPDRVWMISELVNGQTLEAMIDEGALSDHDIGRIGIGLCEALGHAHQQGVVHRDVKPANVMVSAAWLEGSGGWRLQPAKLMDFGIASIVDGRGSPTRDQGPHAGSRGYTPPEQAAGLPATPAGDVHSLATVLFEAFSGELPRAGRRGQLARVRRDLPAELCWAIDSALSADPALRPEVTEIQAALHAALDQLSQQLASPRFSTRLASLFGRRARPAAESLPVPRRAQPRALPQADFADELGGGRLWRFGLAAAAAAATLLTMLAAGLTLSPVAPVVAAVLIVLMPRAGWLLAGLAGALALALSGAPGAALFLLPPALVAACAALAPLPRIFDGALAGAGAFFWVVALQALSGSSVALAQPTVADQADQLRAHLDVALHTLTTFAAPAWAALLGLWMLAGVAALLLVERRAGSALWGAFVALLLVAQVTLGELLHASVPTTTIVALLLLAGALGGTAWMRRGAGRVQEPVPHRREARRGRGERAGA